MSREWKPGDVCSIPGVGRGIMSNCGSWLTARGERTARFVGVDPLLVLDPDDRETCGELVLAFREALGWENGPLDPSDTYTDAMQAAVRSLLDPKPEEPKSLGAVVRDREGKRYTRMDSRDPQPWWQDSTGDDEQHIARMFAWDDIDAIEVLSHGVPEDGAR